MTEEQVKQDIEELVRRLESSPFSSSDIREAGQLLVGAQAHSQSYRMAVTFTDSKFPQVRMLGLAMIEALAPYFEPAKGFLAGAKDAAKVLENGNMPMVEAKPNAPDYSAIGEVIKMWLRQSRQNLKGGSR